MIMKVKVNLDIGVGVGEYRTIKMLHYIKKEIKLFKDQSKTSKGY